MSDFINSGKGHHLPINPAPLYSHGGRATMKKSPNLTTMSARKDSRGRLETLRGDIPILYQPGRPTSSSSPIGKKNPATGDALDQGQGHIVVKRTVLSSTESYCEGKGVASYSWSIKDPRQHSLEESLLSTNTNPWLDRYQRYSKNGGDGDLQCSPKSNASTGSPNIRGRTDVDCGTAKSKFSKTESPVSKKRVILCRPKSSPKVHSSSNPVTIPTHGQDDVSNSKNVKDNVQTPMLNLNDSATIKDLMERERRNSRDSSAKRRDYHSSRNSIPSTTKSPSYSDNGSTYSKSTNGASREQVTPSRSEQFDDLNNEDITVSNCQKSTARPDRTGTKTAHSENRHLEGSTDSSTMVYKTTHVQINTTDDNLVTKRIVVILPKKKCSTRQLPSKQFVEAEQRSHSKKEEKPTSTTKATQICNLEESKITDMKTSFSKHLRNNPREAKVSNGKEVSKVHGERRSHRKLEERSRSKGHSHQESGTSRNSYTNDQKYMGEDKRKSDDAKGKSSSREQAEQERENRHSEVKNTSCEKTTDNAVIDRQKRTIDRHSMNACKGDSIGFAEGTKVDTKVTSETESTSSYYGIEISAGGTSPCHGSGQKTSRTLRRKEERIAPDKGVKHVSENKQASHSKAKGVPKTNEEPIVHSPTSAYVPEASPEDVEIVILENGDSWPILVNGATYSITCSDPRLQAAIKSGQKLHITSPNPTTTCETMATVNTASPMVKNIPNAPTVETRNIGGKTTTNPSHIINSPDSPANARMGSLCSERISKIIQPQTASAPSTEATTRANVRESHPRASTGTQQLFKSIALPKKGDIICGDQTIMQRDRPPIGRKNTPRSESSNENGSPGIRVGEVSKHMVEARKQVSVSKEKGSVSPSQRLEIGNLVKKQSSSKPVETSRNKAVIEKRSSKASIKEAPRSITECTSYSKVKDSVISTHNFKDKCSSPQLENSKYSLKNTSIHVPSNDIMSPADIFTSTAPHDNRDEILRQQPRSGPVRNKPDDDCDENSIVLDLVPKFAKKKKKQKKKKHVLDVDSSDSWHSLPAAEPLVITLRKDVRTGEEIPGTEGQIADASLYSVVSPKTKGNHQENYKEIQPRPRFEHRKITRPDFMDFDTFEENDSRAREDVVSEGPELFEGGAVDQEKENTECKTDLNLENEKLVPDQEGFEDLLPWELKHLNELSPDKSEPGQQHEYFESIGCDDVEMGWSSNSDSLEQDDRPGISYTKSEIDMFTPDSRVDLLVTGKGLFLNTDYSLQTNGKGVTPKDKPLPYFLLEEEEINSFCSKEKSEVTPYDEISGDILVGDLLVDGQAIMPTKPPFRPDGDDEGGIPDECYEEDMVKGDTYLGKSLDWSKNLQPEVKGVVLREAVPVVQSDSFGFLYQRSPKHNNQTVYDDFYESDYGNDTENVDSGHGSLQILGVGFNQETGKHVKQGEKTKVSFLIQDLGHLHKILQEVKDEVEGDNYLIMNLKTEFQGKLQRRIVEVKSLLDVLKLRNTNDTSFEFAENVVGHLTTVIAAQTELLKVTKSHNNNTAPFTSSRQIFRDFQTVANKSVHENINFVVTSVDMILSTLRKMKIEDDSAMCSQSMMVLDLTAPPSLSREQSAKGLNEYITKEITMTPPVLSALQLSRKVTFNSPAHQELVDSLEYSMDNKRKRQMVSSDSSDSSISQSNISKCLSVSIEVNKTASEKKVRQQKKRVCQIDLIPSHSADWRNELRDKDDMTSTPIRQASGKKNGEAVLDTVVEDAKYCEGDGAKVNTSASRSSGAAHHSRQMYQSSSPCKADAGNADHMLKIIAGVTAQPTVTPGSNSQSGTDISSDSDKSIKKSLTIETGTGRCGQLEYRGTPQSQNIGRLGIRDHGFMSASSVYDGVHGWQGRTKLFEISKSLQRSRSVTEIMRGKQWWLFRVAYPSDQREEVKENITCHCFSPDSDDVVLYCISKDGLKFMRLATRKELNVIVKPKFEIINVIGKTQNVQTASVMQVNAYLKGVKGQRIFANIVKKSHEGNAPLNGRDQSDKLIGEKKPEGSNSLATLHAQERCHGQVPQHVADWPLRGRSLDASTAVHRNQKLAEPVKNSIIGLRWNPSQVVRRGSSESCNDLKVDSQQSNCDDLLLATNSYDDLLSSAVGTTSTHSSIPTKEIFCKSMDLPGLVDSSNEDKIRSGAGLKKSPAKRRRWISTSSCTNEAAIPRGGSIHVKRNLSSSFDTIPSNVQDNSGSSEEDPPRLLHRNADRVTHSVRSGQGDLSRPRCGQAMGKSEEHDEPAREDTDTENMVEGDNAFDPTVYKGSPRISEANRNLSRMAKNKSLGKSMKVKETDDSPDVRLIGTQRRSRKASAAARKGSSVSPELVTPGKRRGFPHTEACRKIFDELWNMTESDPFASDRKELPADYHKIVKRPMWLEWISRKLAYGAYIHRSDFVHDVKRIFWNCRLYNKSGKILQDCCNLEEIFKNLLLEHFPVEFDELIELTGNPEECRRDSDHMTEESECIIIRTDASPVRELID